MKTNLARVLLLAAIVASPAHAIDIVSSGASGVGQVNLSGTYTQNFDGLQAPAHSASVPWQNNITIPGWYSTQSSYSSDAIIGLNSFGFDADRALGSAGANWSVRFVNTTTQIITGFSVSYDVEQWYRAENSPQVDTQLWLYYRIYNPNVTEAVEVGNISGISSWIEVPGGHTGSINLTSTNAAFLDGNASENQIVFENVSAALTLNPGHKLWLKWVVGAPGLAGAHALATDNISISFLTAPIPEPATATALLGLAALACASCRRNRR